MFSLLFASISDDAAHCRGKNAIFSSEPTKKRSLYDRHLGLWERSFPCQIFVVTSEEFKRSPGDVVNRIFAWLGLPAVDFTTRTEMTARGLQKIQGKHSKALKSEYEFGFNKELIMPWRLRHGAKPEDAELGIAPAVSSITKMEADQIFMARWSDGMVMKISDLTNGQLLELLKGGDSVNKQRPLWAATVLKSNNEMTITQRSDLNLLLSAKEQKKQLVNIKVDKFGEIPPTPEGKTCVPILPNDNPTVVKALELLQPGRARVRQPKRADGRRVRRGEHDGHRLIQHRLIPERSRR